MRSPLLLLSGCFALGILFSHAQGGTGFLYLLACLSCTLTGLFALWRNWRRGALLYILIGFLFAGASAARLFRYRFPPDHVAHLSEWGFDLSRPVRVEGTLATNPLLMPYGIQFDLQVLSISEGNVARQAVGKIRLRVWNGWHSSLPAASLGLHYGDAVSALARLRRPHNYENPGSFNYRRWLQSIQDITWEGTVEQPDLIEKLPTTHSLSFWRWIQAVRQKLLDSIDQLYPPWSLEGRDGAVLKAILLGDRSSLDSNTVEDFRKSGLYHLLVVAGLHVGLLAMLAGGLLRLLRLREPWRTALLIVFLGFYATLVEQRAPTLRATLMIVAYLLARLLDREQPALNAIGLAALILLFHRPAWLFDSGFQLSFAAALLIAGLAAPILERTTEPYRRALRHIQDSSFDVALEPRLAQFRLDLRLAADWMMHGLPFLSARPGLPLMVLTVPMRVVIWIIDLLIFSVIVQMGLLLPMVEIFHRVTLAGIGLNALAIPVMTFLLAIAVPVVVFHAAVPALAVLPAKLLSLVMSWLFSLTQIPGLPHWLSFRVPNPPLWVAWGFGLSIVVTACALAFHWRLFGASAALAAVTFSLLLALDPFAPRVPKGILQVADLDCGGGEALFLAFPDRTTMMVNACGGSRRRLGGGDPFRARRWDPGENIVSPYLWWRGIKDVDIFLLTDSGADYLSGVSAILRNFRVKEFWYGALPSHQAEASLHELLEQCGVQALRLEAGQRIHFSKTSFDVLAAPNGQDSSADADSIPSIALRISGTAGSILLAGDLRDGGIKRILNSQAPIQSDILQAPRGALTAHLLSTLAARVGPRVTLATSEETRSEQALNPETSQPFRETNRELFRVGMDGLVTINLRGSELAVERYHGEEP
jgi:competence protein ComEC